MNVYYNHWPIIADKNSPLIISRPIASLEEPPVGEGVDETPVGEVGGTVFGLKVCQIGG